MVIFILGRKYKEYGEYIGVYTFGGSLEGCYMFNSGQKDGEDRYLINYVSPHDDELIKYLIK